ncbi:hypothetical protein [Alkalicaulis satelles]|uniref:hypothetical protein n=1 Tax=Alkalicaulis satelles TaxID=2609175 RepID=UPI0018ECEA83|nr:hypothetical protein [Alkalicaulis satelles]
MTRKSRLPGLTDEDVKAFRASTQAAIREHAHSQESAQAYLIKLGILTPKGNLKRVYAR